MHLFIKQLKISITLNNSQKDDNNKKEKGDIEKDSVGLIVVTSWLSNLITYSTSCSYSFVQMEYKALKPNIY